MAKLLAKGKKIASNLIYCKCKQIEEQWGENIVPQVESTKHKWGYKEKKHQGVAVLQCPM